MGFFNKIIYKTLRSTKKLPATTPKKIKAEARLDKAKREPTIAEIKEEAAKKEKSEVKKVIKASANKEDTKDAYRVLVKPLVSEKGTYLAAQNKYLFEVAAYANKIEIKKAIKAVYGVEPLKVNIINLQGKKVRTGRLTGQTKGKKKAIVTLPKGQTIEVYEGV